MAFAADMPVKAPSPAPAPVYSWTGWYVGGNVGYGWGTTNEMQNDALSNFCTGGEGCPTLTVPGAGVTLAAVASQSFDTNPKGFIGGGQIGYNWQNGNTVYGLEADFQGADIKGTGSFANASSVGSNLTSVLSLAATGSQKLDWLGTVRGRLGLTPTPSSLVYATGGLAYGEVKSNASFSESLTNCVCDAFPTVASSLSQTRVGWVVGGGLEWMFAPHWSFRSETLFYDLGTANLNTTIVQNSAGAPFFGATIQTTAHYNGFISRVGLNYQFH
jgi:outer membrane immunogenic protein